MTRRLPGRRKPNNLPKYTTKPGVPRKQFPEYLCEGCGVRVNELVDVRVWRGLQPTNIKRCTNCKERKNQR